ncbi:hypothetical protein QK355_07750 [Pseudomonas aeruginosa]|uniref:hypothetical protein n=1 Tax=Pseudomonas aeruginosa TaxID=287 RepID=UPI0024A8D8A7|nr:hypothetical protein [Pseudomonas aeruginosa]
MPYFEISLLARCTVVIEAADAKQAEIHAMTEADSGDFETFDAELVCEIAPDRLELYERIADLVLID